jgi:hypothetical protein
LEQVIAANDAMLRKGLLEQKEVLGNKSVRDPAENAAPEDTPQGLEFGDVVEQVQSTAKLLTLLKALREKGLLKTSVGETVESLAKSDCQSAVKLVKHLLPDRAAEIHSIGDKQPEPLPLDRSWRYVRALSNSLTLTLPAPVPVPVPSKQ